MTTITPYRSSLGPSRDGFGQLLRAEWTKFRTVRGWVIGIGVAGLLTVGVGFLNHSQCGTFINGTQTSGCPGAPIGPNGAAVTDSFYFLHQPLTSNGTITVRVTSLTGLYSPSGGMSSPGPAAAGALAGFKPGVQPWAKAGIIIKASTKPGAAYAAMLVTGGNGVRMQYDYTGDIAGRPGRVSAAAPRWLRLVRSGDTVSGYDSLDGSHWDLVGTVTLPKLPGTAQAGLFTASPSYEVLSQGLGQGSGPTLATAAFDHVGRPSPDGTWTGTTVGSGSGALIGLDANSPFYGSFHRSGTAAFTLSGSGDIAPDVLDAPDGVGADPTRVLSSSTFFSLIALLIVGAMFITAEYRRGLIRTTFTATPHRGRVLAAKAIVLAAVTFAVGAVATAIALPVGESVLSGGGNWIPPVPALTEIRIVVGTAAVLAVASVLALAIGAITRRGVTAVSAVIVGLALPFLLVIIPGVLPPGVQEWLVRISPAAAFAVQQAFPAYHQVIAAYTPAWGYYPLAPLAGFAVLCAWAAGALAVAVYLLRRRDA